MKPDYFAGFDPQSVPSPCYVVDRAAVEDNLRVLHDVQERSGARILAALKAFSLWRLGPLVKKYLSGVCASGLYEARLGQEEYGGEIHTYSAAFREQDLKEILQICHHVVFNSFDQWRCYQSLITRAQAKRPELKFGLRINPRHSEGTVPLYDPCAPGSRLGIPISEFEFDHLEGISGLLFHTLCEQDFPPLERTIHVVEQQFGHILPRMEWINFGGGHHITREDYQVDDLIRLIGDFSRRHGVQVYLEPGEAVAIHTGILVTEVLDIVHNEMPIAVLDSSATCHMPDTLEMPYRADIRDAGRPDEKPFTYRLGGMSCLAGDVMGDYSFDQPLEIGQRLIFEDMAHYTMVKTTTFNGVPLPAIALWDSRSNELEIVREFGYEDFKNRLS